MIAPFFILFFIFTVVPVLLSIVLSFTTFNLLEWPTLVYADNYIRLFLDDEIFLIAVKNTLMFAIITGPASYLLSLFFAWFINELRPKIRAVVTLLFYAPSISGNVYLIWTIIFSSDQYGYANALLMKFNIIQKPILWFQDEKYIFTLVVLVALWTSLGTSFLTFIAGFQVVDKSLYEAGAIDGIDPVLVGATTTGKGTDAGAQAVPGAGTGSVPVPMPAARTPEEAFASRCAAIAEEFSLTPREAEVFAMLARGRDRAYIEEALVVSRNTVKAHVKHVYAKLGIHSHQELLDLVEG